MKTSTFLATLGIVWLTSMTTTMAAEKFLDRGAKEWKFLDTADAPEKNWNTLEFDDQKWKSGQAPLGYGDPDIKQELSFGDDESNKRICVFLRRVVEVKNPNAIKKVVGKLICDDGCVIYVNGKEVYRFNLPDGEIKHDTTAGFANGGELERFAMTFLVDADKFQAGKNVIAVRLHQAAATSSDLALDMSLEGLSDEAAIEAAEEQFAQEQETLDEIVEQAF